MTTFALTDPPLKRLFARLDFAPHPHDPALAELFDSWQVLRDGDVAPKEDAFGLAKLGIAARHAFRFRTGPEPRSYTLAEGEDALAPLLGHCKIGDRLSLAPDLRAAARLRRLFEAVQKAGEPVLAEFMLHHGGRFSQIVEIFAAPLAPSGESSATSIFGGIAIREMVHRPLFRHAARTADDEPMIFALKGAQALGEKIAAVLDLPLAAHEERNFEDGEHKLRPRASVRGRDVFILDSLTSSPDSIHDSINDRLIKFVFFVATLRQAGARRITAVLPYLCYARKDRQTKSRDPVATRYVAQILESMGIDEMISVTAHNLAAFQNAFRCPTIHLDTDRLFARYLAPRLKDKKVSVVSPDLGGGKRAELFREALELELKRPVVKAFLDKQRSMGVVTGEIFAGDVAGATALILDDMIGTGETMIRAASACQQHGAKEILALATHGLFIGANPTLLQQSALDRIIITDSVPLRPALTDGPLSAKLEIVSLAGLLGETIRIAHTGGSITALLRDDVSPDTLQLDAPRALH